ncbi:MAG: hypothetical protein C4526_06595 [Nitrospiraceae bacterium]|nr:MAG: hypothetical protein C4526_06595 [Nitrospiraceae bacterium]
MLIWMLLLLIVSFIVGCASTTPIPANITFFEPPPGIHPKLFAFWGLWKGKWYQSQDVTLIIERIDSNYAEIIFSVGFINASGLEPQNSFYYVRGEVLNDSAIGWGTANGNRFIFEMQEGFREIKGYFIEGKTGATIHADMFRADIDELSDVKIHKYPYVEFRHPLKNPRDFEHDNNLCWREAEKQTVLLSFDIRRYTMWEKLNRCLEDLGWMPITNDSQTDIKL